MAPEATRGKTFILWWVWIGVLSLTLSLPVSTIRLVDPPADLLTPSTLAYLVVANLALAAVFIAAAKWWRRRYFFDDLDQQRFADHEELASHYQTTSFVTWSVGLAVGLVTFGIAVATDVAEIHLGFIGSSIALIVGFPPRLGSIPDDHPTGSDGPSDANTEPGSRD